MTDSVRILWLYPSVLNLHGDRGNLMALSRISAMMGMEAQIIRVEAPQDPLPLDEADMVCICPGQVRDTAALAAAAEGDALRRYAESGGIIMAWGTGGAMLAREIHRHDGSIVAGTGLLPMICRERDAVYGDDIWFNTADGTEILGNQIQVVDTVLDEGARPYGTLIYGHGNNGGRDEGCRRDNIIFTNTLGPMLVKNPLLTQKLLVMMAERRGFVPPRLLNDEDTEYERRSAQLIRAFIRKKMA